MFYQIDSSFDPLLLAPETIRLKWLYKREILLVQTCSTAFWSSLLSLFYSHAKESRLQACSPFQIFFTFAPPAQLSPPCTAALPLISQKYPIFHIWYGANWLANFNKSVDFILSRTKQHGVKADTTVRCFRERNRLLTQGFTLKNYWNCLPINAGLKNKL